MVKKTDRLGSVFTNTYDRLNRLTKTTVKKSNGSAATENVSIIYNLNGTRREEKNESLTTTYQYDDAGRVTQQTEVTSASTLNGHALPTSTVVKTFTYDARDNQKSLTLKNNNAATLSQTYDYDSMNRLTKVYENGVSEAAYTYDLNGNRSGLTYGNGIVTTYTYNAANLITELANKKGGAALSSYKYTYKLDGNQDSKKDNNGTATTYTYDGLGRLTNETETLDFIPSKTPTPTNTPTKTPTKTNTPTKAPTKTNTPTKTPTKTPAKTITPTITPKPGGIAPGPGQPGINPPVQVLSLPSEPLNTEVNVLTDTANSTANLTLESEYKKTEKSYSYDQAGNRSSMAVRLTTLSGETSAGYTVTYTYNANNQLLSESKQPLTGSASVTNYQYDLNGNQISKSANGSTQTFAYDVFNRLIKTSVSGDVTNYRYKADGLRVSKNNIPASNAAETTVHVWDGSDIAVELDGAGGVKAKYVRGVNLIKNVALSNNADNRYTLYNAHGDVTQLADSSGVVRQNYRYDAFGVEVEISGDRNPFRYGGEYFDRETGMIYLRTRYYDPRSSRLVSEDPIRDGLNYYTYCRNNPINFWDPFGLAPVGLRDAVKEYYGSDSDLKWDPETKTASIYGVSFSAVLGNAYINSKGIMIVDDSIFVKNPLPGRGLVVNQARDTVVIAATIVLGVKGPGVVKAVVKVAGPVLAPVGAKLNEGANYLLGKASSAVNFVGNKIFSANVMSPAQAAQKIRVATRVGTALNKTDKFHRAGSFLSETQLAQGTTSNLVGGDGVRRTLLEVAGELDGVKGIYEFILQPDGTVSHQCFKVFSK
jgi:RHS repeat-associated protein